MSNFSEKTQYDYLYDALAAKFPGIKNADGKGTMFQFVGTPIEATWSKTNLAEAYDFANAVPVNLDGFYMAGTAAIDAGCKDLYGAVKTNADINLPEYRKYAAQYDAFSKQLADMDVSAFADYQVWAAMHTDAKGIPEEGYRAWFDDPHGGLQWSKRMAAVQLTADDVFRAMQDLIVAAQSPVKDALAAIDTDTMVISYPGSTPKTVPQVAIDGDFSADTARWLLVPDGQYEFDVRISADQEIKSPWKTTYDTKVSQQCWKTSVAVRVDTARVITDAHYELRYTAVGISSYNITRGKWFDGTFVRPGVPLNEGTLVTDDTFFGSKGSLQLIPVNILVMYKPSVALTISAECYKQQFSAYANTKLDWVSMLGFTFDVGENSKLEPITNADGTVTVKFPSPDNAVPQIIGVTSQVLYNGHV
jgi:hypothetical protein